MLSGGAHGGRSAATTFLNARQLSSQVLLPWSHAAAARSAWRMVSLHGHQHDVSEWARSPLSTWGVRSIMRLRVLQMSRRYVFLSGGVRWEQAPDITCMVSGAPWHPGTGHPRRISLVYGALLFLSFFAHLIVLSPSIPGTLLISMPCMMPEREMILVRTSGSVRSGGDVSSSDDDASESCSESLGGGDGALIGCRGSLMCERMSSWLWPEARRSFILLFDTDLDLVFLLFFGYTVWSCSTWLRSSGHASLGVCVSSCVGLSFALIHVVIAFFIMGNGLRSGIGPAFPFEMGLSMHGRLRTRLERASVMETSSTVSDRWALAHASA